MKPNLQTKPFYLNQKQIAWVEETAREMTTEEKAGQLFCVLGDLYSDQELEELVRKYNIGGILFRPATREQLKKKWEKLDKIAPVPLLKAANLEEGSNGAITDGTFFAPQLEVAATSDIEMVTKFARVCALEAARAGINWTFSPVTDLDLNPANPITNVRTFGSHLEQVLSLTSQYMCTVQSCGMAATAKHFPGDGVDYRDQHLCPTYNSLSSKEWYASYGKIYERLIEEGVLSVMAGHIVQPNVAMEQNPNLKEEQVLPASLSREMLDGVLRHKFHFNGVITTDATIMGGYTMAMERKQAIPTTIAAGSDMILFNMDFYEDYEYLLEGIHNGVVSMERLDEAVYRVLALKAKVTSMDKDAIQNGKTKSLPIQEWVNECADKGVTLVKDKNQLLPISPEKFPYIELYLLGQENGVEGNIRAMMEQELIKQGFQVRQMNPVEQELQGTKGLSKDTLKIYMAYYPTQSNQTTVRLHFCEKHALDMHRFPAEQSGIFISFQNPYHLQDVPRIQTYVNAYAPTKANVRAVVHKMTGKSIWKGVSPVDAFCGLRDTRY